MKVYYFWRRGEEGRNGMGHMFLFLFFFLESNTKGCFSLIYEFDRMEDYYTNPLFKSRQMNLHLLVCLHSSDNSMLQCSPFCPSKHLFGRWTFKIYLPKIHIIPRHKAYYVSCSYQNCQNSFCGQFLVLWSGLIRDISKLNTSSDSLWRGRGKGSFFYSVRPSLLQFDTFF